jgi:hypothetical protein
MPGKRAVSARADTPFTMIPSDFERKSRSLQGAQATDCPQASVWSFPCTGGITFGDAPQVPGPASLAVAVTGPDTFVQKLQSGLFA